MDSVWFSALILGLVEGLTEFLPISSTGHLILASSLLNFTGERARLFLIVIQAAAVLAVAWEYRRRLRLALTGLTQAGSARRLIINLVVAFLPLAVLGLLFKGPIEALLFHPVPVAIALVVGGVLILLAEARLSQRHLPLVLTVEEMSLRDAWWVGCAQALALIPGTSRSGATIIGGLFFGLSRRCATDFSFFLAIPTLLSASIYSLWRERQLLHWQDAGLWSVGFIAAFFSALICVRWLLGYIANHDFKVFAWYRIVFGGFILLSASMGWIQWHHA